MNVPVSTEGLIESLRRDLVPVARLRPPLQRAGLWLGAVLAGGVIAIMLFADRDLARTHAAHWSWFVELGGTLATGCIAVVAAFHLSLPDRSPRWALAPLPALAVWLLGSGVGCWRQWGAMGAGGSLEIGESGHCLGFIVGLGLPLGLSLLWMLRRARPLAPLPVALTGALGAAALAAFLLQFFHPFEITAMDLVFHAVAVGVVLGVSAAGGWRILG